VRPGVVALDAALVAGVVVAVAAELVVGAVVACGALVVEPGVFALVLAGVAAAEAEGGAPPVELECPELHPTSVTPAKNIQSTRSRAFAMTTSTRD
jgi:hypothetical protein